jgi:hypothetical protein
MTQTWYILGSENIVFKDGIRRYASFIPILLRIGEIVALLQGRRRMSWSIRAEISGHAGKANKMCYQLQVSWYDRVSSRRQYRGSGIK